MMQVFLDGGPDMSLDQSRVGKDVCELWLSSKHKHKWLNSGRCMDRSSVSIQHQGEMTLPIILGINISSKHLETRMIKPLHYFIALEVIGCSTCFTYSKCFKGLTKNSAFKIPSLVRV